MPPKGTKAPRASAGVSLEKIAREIDKAMAAGDVEKLRKIAFDCLQGKYLAEGALSHLREDDTPEEEREPFHYTISAGDDLKNMTVYGKGEIAPMDIAFDPEKKSPPPFTTEAPQPLIDEEPAVSEDGGDPF